MKEILNRNGNIRNQIKIVETVEREYLLNGNNNVNDIVDKVLEDQNV